MKIGAIVLTRMDSSRLPGKALIKVAGKPIISYVLERAFKIKNVEQVVLATTKRAVDEPLVKYAIEENIPFFRGDTENVAKRVISCCKQYNYDAFVRINGDSPLLHWELIDTAVEKIKEQRYDIVTYPTGMSVEVLEYSAYLKAYARMNDPSDFEHVTTFLYDNPDQFCIHSLLNQNNDWSGIHLAVDNQEDLEQFKWIISKLSNDHTHSSISEIINTQKKYNHKLKS
jgi:spore coat polysaccharide biosynthesis protein SpsF